MHNVFVLSDPSKVRYRRCVCYVSRRSVFLIPFIHFPQIANGMNDGKKYKNGKAETGVPKVVGTEKEKPSVIEAVVPLAWGGGRSFADVLKKEETAGPRTS